jgi:hypothetical protein
MVAGSVAPSRLTLLPSVGASPSMQSRTRDSVPEGTSAQAKWGFLLADRRTWVALSRTAKAKSPGMAAPSLKESLQIFIVISLLAF